MRAATLPLAVSLTLAGLVLGAAPAAAQGGRPVISKVKYSTGKEVRAVPVGGTLYLEGRDLYDPPVQPIDPKTGRPKAVKNPYPGLTVKIDGKACRIFASSLSRVTVQVHPTIKPGKNKTITLNVQGRGSATAKIDVITQKEFTEQDAGAERKGETGSGETESAERRVLGSFNITKFRMVSGGAGQTFQVEGTVKKTVPNGLRVQLSLLYGKRVIRTRAVPIKDGKFTVTFGPYTEKLLVGNYTVQMVFALNKQSRIKLKRWIRKLKKSELTLYKRIVRQEMTSVGGTGPQGRITAEDRAKQEEELKSHSQELANDCQKLMAKLKVAYSGAARVFFRKKSGNFEDALYRGWLIKLKFAVDDAGAQKIQQDTTYGSQRGGFQDRAWETFGRDTLIPELQAAYDRHAKFNKQWIAPPSGRAERLGEFLISNVAKLFEKWTMHLYGKEKMQVPQEIKAMPFPVISAPKTSMKYFEAKRRELLRVVGISVD
jgi:hypothetical protein